MRIAEKPPAQTDRQQASNGTIRELRRDSKQSPSSLPPHTAFLSKLIGLYLILISIPMAVHKDATLDIMNSIMRNPPLLFLVGILGLTAGLALVLAHNVWSGGALPVVVTLAGWAALVKGLLLLFTSTMAQNPGALLAELRYDQLFYFYTGFSILLGAYLTYSGLSSKAKS
jgi:hypothetical protein